MIPIHDDNPTERTPYVTVIFIVANVLIFLWQIAHSPQGQQLIAYGLGVVPAVLFGSRQLPPEVYAVPAPVTVFTSMFLHGGWMHLIGNMLYLWIFGNNVEDSMGPVRFVVFYLLSGVAAVLVHAWPNPESTIPMIGASGAISGVLGAYLLLHPHARVLVLIPLGFILYTVRWPAMAVLGAWFGMQLLSSLFADPNSPGVAFGAHIGGFVAGLALIPFFKYRRIPLWAPPR
ncbi:MAG: rhomboid family intramembrane serine protease [Acidiferrobacterales bacterium]